MSGDLKVRKRKNKTKKKDDGEDGGLSSQGTSSTGSGNSSTTNTPVHMTKVPTTSTSKTDSMSENLGSRRTTGAGGLEGRGSSFLEKMSFVLLLATLIGLAGMIYIHHNSHDLTSHLVNKSLNNVIDTPAVSSYKAPSSAKPSTTVNGNAKTTQTKTDKPKPARKIDLDRIKEQILSDKQIDEASKVPLIQEVVVEILGKVSADKKLADEPLIMKETAHILGGKNVLDNEKDGSIDGDNTKEENEKTVAEVVDKNIKSSVIGEKKLKSKSKETSEEKQGKVIKTDSKDSNKTEYTPDVTTDLKHDTLRENQSSEKPSAVATAQSKSPQIKQSQTKTDLPSLEDERAPQEKEAMSIRDVKPPHTKLHQPVESAELSGSPEEEQVPPMETTQKTRHRRSMKAPDPEELQAQSSIIERGERLMVAVLELYPGHPMVEELRPHLEGAKKDLKDHKLKGMEDTTKNVVLILEDLYVRLVDQKENPETGYIRASRVLEPEGSDTSEPSAKLSPGVSPPKTSDPTTQSDSSTPEQPLPSSSSAPTVAAPNTSPSQSPPQSNSPASISTSEEESTLPAPVAAPALTPNLASTPDPASAPSSAPASASVPGFAPSPALAPASAPAPTISISTTATLASTAGKEEGVVSAGGSAPREVAASDVGLTFSQLTPEDLANPRDEKHAEALRRADQLLDKSPLAALRAYAAVARTEPRSPLAAVGRARSLDALAHQEKRNSRLDEAIAAYTAVLDLADAEPQLISDNLLRATADTLVDKLRFRGNLSACIKVQQRLLQRFPLSVVRRNQLGISFLLDGQVDAAREVFEEVVQSWPDSGLAQVHLGFILVTTTSSTTTTTTNATMAKETTPASSAQDKDSALSASLRSAASLERGVALLRGGMSSGEAGTADDARFVFHLGDALTRLGRRGEARQVYTDGAVRGLFLSADQRSLYNIKRLTARPTWTTRQTTYRPFLQSLEAQWEMIRDEALSLLSPDSNGSGSIVGFQPESENLRASGSWSQFELFSRGRRNSANCARAPKTCALVGAFKPAAGCTRGQIKFSVVSGGTHVWPHCGPTNCRLRAHLGLVVPKEPPKPVLLVAGEECTWEEGKVLVFDDSFEHELWHNGTQRRLVLILDLWHPDLTEHERASLAPI